MKRRTIPTFLGIVAAFTMLFSMMSVAAYHDGDTHNFADPRFQNRWAHADYPVQQVATVRTWIWGPSPYAEGMWEAYAESPGGQRWVQYFDKSRMELNNPADPSTSIWVVTQGLLALDMMRGRVQVGNAIFEDHPDGPSTENVAGDVVPNNGPSYATMGGVIEANAAAEGTVITQTIDHTGAIGVNPALSAHDATAAVRIQVDWIDHTIASPFWNFMNSQGLIWDGSGYTTDYLFAGQPGEVQPFYAVGLPVTEAYWSWVQVGNESKWVLVQCFERRCLTFTPDNDPGWRVEAGNTGQHYYRWLYADPPTEQIEVALVELNESTQQSAMSNHENGTFGCGDSIGWVETEATKSSNPAADIGAALEALFAMGGPFHEESGLYNALYMSDLSVQHVEVNNGDATVHLAGELDTLGFCDELRAIQQIEQTVKQFAAGDFLILLNDEELAPTQIEGFAWGYIDAEVGGTVEYEGEFSKIQIVIPANSPSADAVITVYEEGFPDPDQPITPVTNSWDVNLLAVDAPYDNGPITYGPPIALATQPEIIGPIELRIVYDEDYIPEWADENDLLLCFYDEEAEAWDGIPPEISPSQNTIWGSPSHLSRWGVFVGG